MTTRIYAGAAHWTTEGRTRHTGGIYRQTAGDDRWERLRGGLPEDAEVRAIAIHPRDPRVIYAGTQHGPYKSPDGGDTWKSLGFPDTDMAVWSLAFDPRNPDVLYAGTAPAAVYRSADGGGTWRRLDALKAPGRVKMSFPCRVTRLAIDPTYPDEIYAALEVDGVLRSPDGGATWEDVSRDLVKLAERPHLKSRIVSDTEDEGCRARCSSPSAWGSSGAPTAAGPGRTWRSGASRRSPTRGTCASRRTTPGHSSRVSAPQRAARTARSTRATTWDGAGGASTTA